MKKLEVLLLATLGGFAVTFLVLSRDYNATAAQFPRLIAAASLLFLVLAVIGGRGNSTLTRRSAAPSPNGRGIDLNTVPLPLGEGAAERRVRVELPRPPTLALQAGYVFLIYLIGFFPATLFYLILAPLQLRYPRPGVAIATGLVLTLLLAGSFMWLFDIQIPQGAIWEVL
jgi:hypothetical protein